MRCRVWGLFLLGGWRGKGVTTNLSLLHWTQTSPKLWAECQMNHVPWRFAVRWWQSCVTRHLSYRVDTGQSGRSKANQRAVRVNGWNTVIECHLVSRIFRKKLRDHSARTHGCAEWKVITMVVTVDVIVAMSIIRRWAMIPEQKAHQWVKSTKCLDVRKLLKVRKKYSLPRVQSALVGCAKSWAQKLFEFWVCAPAHHTRTLSHCVWQPDLS